RRLESPMTLREQLRVLARALRSQRGALLLLALIVAGGAAAALLGPVFISDYIDADTGGVASRVTLAAILFLVTACAQPLLSVAETWVAALVAWRSTNQLRQQLFEHCLQGDLDLVQRHPPGTLITRIDGDAEVLAEFLSTFLARLATAALTLAGVVLILALVDWLLGAVLALAIVLCGAALYGPRPLQLRLWRRNREATAQELGLAEEMLTAADDLRWNGGVGWALRTYWRRARQTYRTYWHATLVEYVSLGATYVLYGWATVAALLVATVLHGQGQIPLGTVYLVYAYASAVATPLQMVSRQIQLLQSAGAALTRIQQLLAEQPRVRWTSTPRPLPHAAPAIDLERVDFAYPGDPPSLHDVTLHVEAARRVGVVGRTGSGKTTLARLLLRFQDPDRGAVRLHGVDLRETSREGLRRLVGFVPQDVQLLHATLRDNLTLFDAGVDDDRLREALRAVGLEEWVRGLPAGLDTPLAPGGRDLSAGQSQLLAAARVFLADPGLLVLDEASSRVDPDTERRLHEGFARLFQGRTAVVIAHRLSTLHEVDDILILDRGRVAEFGPREQLLRDAERRFARLLQGVRP
ncbi:MAG: ABC transporter ATP-binding protein, partial [Candidatus Dormibacteraeota bacterium]|nr:ABC transporter ATP-binding protein [Candidatus Dormibacteraeota bacterium]